MSGVFLDTVGLIAVWDRSDQWHADASTVYREMTEAGRVVITTAQVLWECGNSAARRPYRRRVHALWNVFEKEGTLAEPTADEIQAAWLAYDRGEADRAGIVDHISFIVMRRLGLSEAFTQRPAFCRRRI